MNTQHLVAQFVAAGGQIKRLPAAKPTLFFSRVDQTPEPEQPVERHYSGNEHGLIFAEYLSDDEYLADLNPDLDQVSHQTWVDAEAQEDWIR